MAALEGEPKRVTPRLRTGTFDEYSSIVDKDSFTLYFAYDTLQLFRGNKEYTKSVELVEELPAEGIFGKLYVVKKESTSLHVWDKSNSNFIKISEETPTLQKVLDAGSTVTDRQITFKSREGNKTVLLNENGISNIDTEGSTVKTSSMNDEQILLTENPGSIDSKFISMSIAGGFRDNKSKVLSSNPDESRNLSEEEASVMRSRLNVSSNEETSQKLEKGLSKKVDKGLGFLVKNFEISINSELEGNGFSIRKTRVDIDGNQENEVKETKLTASDLGVATTVQVNEVQKEIETVKSGLVRLSLDFSLAFSNAADPANPTMAEVMTFLSKMGITPHSGTSLLNSKIGMSTYKNTFVFYTNPYDPTSSLVLVNEGILGASVATQETLGIVKGSGDIRVDTEGNMFIRSDSVKPYHLSDNLREMFNGKADSETVNSLKEQITNHTLDSAVHLTTDDRDKIDKIDITGHGNKVLTNDGDYQDISIIAEQI